MFFKIISKLLFRFYSLISILSDKYRLSYFKHLYGNQLVLQGGIHFGKGSSIVFFPGSALGKLLLGARCIFRKRCTLSIDGTGQMTLGNDNFFNNNCSITCLGKINIGDNNLFGENVKMYDHNHEYRDSSSLIRNQGFRIGEIIIGNNCWFGSNCTILSNVVIGDNVVVGANVLVYKSIPSNSVVRATLPLVIEPNLRIK
jgi:acetyltransferase-like isoleucine patch superfamily enzyme